MKTFSYPFRKGKNGYGAQVEGQAAYDEAIKNICRTKPGSIPYNPEIGIVLQRMLFENKGPSLMGSVARMLGAAVRRARKDMRVVSAKPTSFTVPQGEGVLFDVAWEADGAEGGVSSVTVRSTK